MPCGAAREAAWWADGEVERRGVRGGFFAVAGTGRPACEQGFHGGDSTPCAHGPARDGVGFEVAGGQPRRGEAEIAGKIARVGTEANPGEAGGGRAGATPQGKALAGNQIENAGIEAPPVGNQKTAEPLANVTRGGGRLRLTPNNPGSRRCAAPVSCDQLLEWADAVARASRAGLKRANLARHPSMRFFEKIPSNVLPGGRDGLFFPPNYGKNCMARAQQAQTENR